MALVHRGATGRASATAAAAAAGPTDATAQPTNPTYTAFVAASAAWAASSRIAAFKPRAVNATALARVVPRRWQREG